MRSEIAGKYMEKYSLGVVDAQNSLQSYNSYFRNMGFSGTIEELVKERLAKKSPVLILDIGCGNAGFLHGLKEIFGPKIRTIGIDLIEPPMENQPDEMFMGDAAETKFPEKIDFVFSFRALHEIGEPEKIVEKAYNCLAPGGKAFLSFRTMDLSTGQKGLEEIREKEIKSLLKMVRSRRLKGFRVEGFEVSVKDENGKKLTAGVNVFLEK
ncbi:Methyltransferase domain protein [uncultured archaeon]|nr:Methyltransferase domain protein [uncultured archaeon]